MKYYNNYTSDKNIPESYNPLVDEKKILDFWTKEQTYEKIQENRQQENDGTFSFHSGPPFLTGSPHCGHILNSIVKDIFTRYGYQKKRQVVSQFGWDCHGIAIEHEVDKKLGIKTLDDIHKMGIAKYNGECRKFVQRHEAEWTNVFERLGNRVDFKNAYSTMSAEYMESVWCIFKQLYDKGLVYRETKVLPFSTGCFTHLSNFEADMNWKDVTEIGLTIAIDIVDSIDRLLIWTISPWTLVENLAICVNPNSKYVKVKMVDSERVYILSKDRLPFVFRNADNYNILDEIVGKELENLRCKPLFNCIQGNSRELYVLVDKCVETDVGTGIKVLSGYFSDDDYRVCRENGIVCDESLCPIDNSGRLKGNISDVAGLTISEANDVILAKLKQRGCLVAAEDINHRRPHCWRSDVPLIRKASSAFFIKFEDVKGKMEENNSQVNWINCNGNEIMKSFESNNWPISRNKFWGTPVPIWSSPSGDEVRCIGSVKELMHLTGCTIISDLHREYIDKLLIPSSVAGNPPLRRVSEIFDCWFDSGVMPFIQQRSQVDFVAEGSDQVSGWFYTTSLLSVALSLPSASKNVFAHGLVQEPDGTKFSKRKHNHNEPIHIADKYGADALRLYLMTTPLTAGEHFALREEEVSKINEIIIYPLFKIPCDIMPLFGKLDWVSYGVIIDSEYYPNIIDKWILSRLESLLQFYDAELSSYRLHLVVPRILEFFEQLRDWYLPIRCPESKNEEERSVLLENIRDILFTILYRTLTLLAPFAPFCTEYTYQLVRPYIAYRRKESVHDTEIMEPFNELILLHVELQVSRWQTIVELIRQVRANHIIPVQYRIAELFVIHPGSYLEENEQLAETIKKLENINQVVKTKDRNMVGAILKAELKPECSLCDSTSTTELEKVAMVIRKLTDKEIDDFLVRGFFNIHEHNIPLEDIQLSYQVDKELDTGLGIISKDDLLIAVRMKKDFSYYQEGTRRGLISAVQKLKKSCKLFLSERVTIWYSTRDKCLQKAFEKYALDVGQSTNSVLNRMEDSKEIKAGVVQENVHITGAPVTLYLLKEN